MARGLGVVVQISKFASGEIEAPFVNITCLVSEHVSVVMIIGAGWGPNVSGYQTVSHQTWD